MLCLYIPVMEHLIWGDLTFYSIKKPLSGEEMLILPSAIYMTRIIIVGNKKYITITFDEIWGRSNCVSQIPSDQHEHWKN